jgi:hypothetical protein
MKTYPVPATGFSGAKFAARYSLVDDDFGINAEGLIFVRPVLPDDPPIFEPSDPLVSPPLGMHVHTMRKAEGKKGNSFVIDQAESNCIHVVMDHESQLNDPWLLSIPMDPGSAAYCRDTEKQWFWNGTMWKKP